MEFKEFTKEVANALEKRPEMEGFTVDLKPCEKLNGQSYDALVICKEGSNVGVSINLKNFFHAHKGQLNDLVLSEIAEYALKGLSMAPVGTSDLLESYEKVKDRLILEVISLDKNSEMLKGIPHIEKEDLALIVRIEVGAKNSAVSTAVVTDSIMKSFGITKDQLFNDAFSAVLTTAPAKIEGLTQLIRKMSGMDENDLPELNSSLMVLSNEESYFGASCMFYPGVLEMISNKVGGNFVILPSSIHEVIILGDPGCEGYKDLGCMVREINAAEVAEADRLTDSVYLYEVDKHDFKRVC